MEAQPKTQNSQLKTPDVLHQEILMLWGPLPRPAGAAGQLADLIRESQQAGQAIYGLYRTSDAALDGDLTTKAPSHEEFGTADERG